MYYFNRHLEMQSIVQCIQHIFYTILYLLHYLKPLIAKAEVPKGGHVVHHHHCYSELKTVILLSFSKTFDSISHELIIKALGSPGVSGTAKTWFKSYLEEKKQFVEHKYTTKWRKKEIRYKFCESREACYRAQY